MKILINTPIISIPAGVSNHYLGLRTYFSKDIIYNQYIPGHYINQNIKFKPLCKFIRLITAGYDLLKFVILIVIHKKPVILLNPSFGETALKRDLIFLKIAKCARCKVAVFIHGWDKKYLESLIKNEIRFDHAWLKADAWFVLAVEFKGYLEEIGIKTPIYLTTTKVDDRCIDEKVEKKTIQKINNILFLGRVEKEKGIFTTIEVIDILNEKYQDISLRVVGYGEMLEQARLYARDKGLNNIIFTGPLYGDDLKNEFLKADLYILPSYHEGMPTTVLEAMAFGLPVITRPVGGLKDFFENGKMGYAIESLKPADFVHYIEILKKDISLTERISKYNKRFAKDHFMASQIAKKLEATLNSI